MQLGKAVGLFLFSTLAITPNTAFAFGKKPVQEGPPPANGGPTTEHGTFILRVLSYNVHGLPEPLVTDKGQYRQIGSILAKRRAEGTAPHVVALQEAFTDGSSDIPTFANYPYVVKGPEGALLTLSSGLWTMSEFPVLQNDSITYDDCAGWDCRSRKGAMHLRLQLPGFPFPVEIYQTHLNSDPDTDFWTPIEDTQDARLKQAQRLAQFISETTLPGAAMFVPGDFNFWNGNIDYMIFQGSTHTQNAAQICSTINCDGDGTPLNDTKLSVDHQFYSSNHSGLRIEPIHYERTFREKFEGDPLSDHLGLEVHYRLTW